MASETSERDAARLKAESDAAAARIAARRKADALAKTPREAKIALVVGVSILALMLTAGAWTYLSRFIDTTTPAPPPPQAGPAAPGPAPTKEVRRVYGGGDGGGGMASGGPGGGAARDDAPPIPAGALAVLKGLRAYLFQTSHSTRSALDASQGVDQGLFPPGALDGASASVEQNLRLAALRTARFPVDGIRVLNQTARLGGVEYEIEAMSVDNQGITVVSRSRVAVEPTGNGEYRLAQLDSFQPFDEPGAVPAKPDAPAQPSTVVRPMPPPPGKNGASSAPGPDAPQTGFPYVIR